MAIAEVLPGARSTSMSSGLPKSAAVLNSKLPIVVWLYLLGIAIPLWFNVGSLSMSTMRLVLLIAVVPLSFALFRKKYGRVIPTDILLFLHILWAVIALGVNNPDKVVENIGSAAVELIGGYVVGRAFIRTPEQFGALCRTLFVIVIIWLPFSILEARNGRPLILELIESLPGITTYADVSKDLRLGMNRVQLVFAHPIHYGLFCSIVFSLAFVGFKGVYGDAKRWMVAGAVGVCTFLSLSSGALLALILQLGMISWAFIFQKVERKWLLLLGLFAVAYVVVDLLSNRTPIRVMMSYATFSAHTAYWRGLIFEYGMLNVWANPIFGIGLNEWFRPHYMNSGSMDNFWLVMAVRYGIPGSSLITRAYIDILRRVGTRDFRADPLVSQFRLAWMFTFLGLSFTLSTVHIWTSLFSFVFFLLGAGVWMIDYQPKSAGAAGPTESGSRRAPLQYSRAPQTPASVKAEAAPEPGTDAPVANAVRSSLRFTRFARQPIGQAEAPKAGDAKT